MQELTERQRETLVAYIRAGTVPLTADALGISERTVKGHLEIVCRKLGADGIRGLTAAAVRAGIVRLEVA
jgi:DNA-binding CsgD family transcriptional regulator